MADLIKRLASHMVSWKRAGSEAAAQEPAIHRFLREIGLPGQITEPRSRYLHLPELYVKPEEYEKIRTILIEHHAVVIAGDPHMGKTYTALHLLWEVFQNGWNVVHMRRDALAAALQQCEHIMNEFATQHLKPKCFLHLDDPFGEIEYQPLGPLQKDLSRLVREVRDRGDCGLIITSRIGIFNWSMGRLEGPMLLGKMRVEDDIRVHTSYSEDTRREVLKRYLKLYEPPWAADKALRGRVLAQVPRILDAPHNLELFARRAEGISEEGELLDFARSCREMVPALAEWMGRMSAEDQLVLVLTETFGYRDLAELRVFHREVLARAYAEGLVEHMAGTAWDSALGRLRDIVTVAQERYALSFVHPSYSEALRRALRAGPRLAAVWLLAMTAASTAPDPDWRADAGKSLALSYENLDGEGRKLLASLAADETEGVRRTVASPLAINYENLDEEGRNLLASLAADEAEWVRGDVASSLAYKCLKLDGEGRKLLACLVADEAEGVRRRVASLLADNSENLDGAGRKLLASLSADEAERVRGEVASLLAYNYQNLDGEGRKLVASLAADEAETVRGQVASWLARNWENLDRAGRKLLASLAVDEADGVRRWVVASLARTYGNLDGEGWKLLEQVRSSLKDH